MSRLHLEESVAAVLSLLRSQPTSLIPALQGLEGKFIGVTPIVALTPTRRLRIPEGKDIVSQAISYLQAREPVQALQYSFGMSEAARAKFSSNDSLTDRFKSRGQWTGTCSDFVQLGVEDLDAETIVCLMVISAGDPNRQIRERLFSPDKGCVGVAIGPYKQSLGVAVTLATKFVNNAPTDEEYQRVRSAAAGGANVLPVDQGAMEAATQEAMSAMKHAARPAGDDYNKTDAELEQERQIHLASLEARRPAEGGRVVTHDDGDDEMAAIQAERMAKLAALERANNPGSYASDAMPPGYDHVEHDAPARDIAYDPSIESYEEAEAKKRAFFEQQERAKREAMEKAEAAKKSAWQAERKAREEQKKKEEAERLARLQAQQFGRPNFTVGVGAAPGMGTYAASRVAAKTAPAPAVVRAPPVNASVVTRDPKDDEMDALQRERMAKIAELERANQRNMSGGTQDDVTTAYGSSDSSSVVGADSQPAEYDPTRESFEEAEARKREFFAAQERAKREALAQAEAAKKANWQAERKAREEAKKREEAERLARLQGDYNAGRTFGNTGKSSALVNRSAPEPQKSPRQEPSKSPRGEIVRGTPAGQSYSTVPSTPAYSTSSGGDDLDDPIAKEEARLAALMAKKGGPAVFGAVDPAAQREAKLKQMEEERKAREAKMAALREEKWREESRKAEEAAAKRREEAEAKARALAEGRPEAEAIIQHELQTGHLPAAAAVAVAPASAAVEEAPIAEVEPTFEASHVGAEVSAEVGGQGGGDFDELYACSEDTPARLFLNALLRPEESVEIKSLSEIREAVSYYTRGGHIVLRTGKYTLLVGDQAVTIPPHHLLNDDFNALSDYFFFQSSPYLSLYPTEERNEADEMQVSNIAELQVDTRYYLASGNYVSIQGGENPQFLLDGQTEIALPDEVVDALRAK